MVEVVFGGIREINIEREPLAHDVGNNFHRKQMPVSAVGNPRAHALPVLHVCIDDVKKGSFVNRRKQPLRVVSFSLTERTFRIVCCSVLLEMNLPDFNNQFTLGKEWHPT